MTTCISNSCSLALIVSLSLGLISCGQAQQQELPNDDKEREIDPHSLRKPQPSRLNDMENPFDQDSKPAMPPINIAGANLTGECYYLDPGVLNATLGYLTCRVGDGSLENYSGVHVDLKFKSNTFLTAIRLGEAGELVAPTITLSQDEFNDIESVTLSFVGQNSLRIVTNLTVPKKYGDANAKGRPKLAEIEKEEKLTKKSGKTQRAESNSDKTPSDAASPHGHAPNEYQEEGEPDQKAESKEKSSKGSNADSIDG